MAELQKSLKDKLNKHVTPIAYAGLIFVVVVWGTVPIFTNKLVGKEGVYSPSLYNGVVGLIAAVALLVIFAPKLRALHKGYFLLAVPTGAFNSIASLLQKIGLKYTTETQYAFLENLSCIVVPILLFFFIKKKPSLTTIFACVLCLVGSFVLNWSKDGLSFGIGEILCALAGLCYGVNIAATGVFAKEMNAGLYVMIQSGCRRFYPLSLPFAFRISKLAAHPLSQCSFRGKQSIYGRLSLWHWARVRFVG